MNGCDETVHHEPLSLNLDRRIFERTAQMFPSISVIKTLESRSLDRDQTVQMQLSNQAL